MNREDFPLLKSNIIYFDNAATTLKPSILGEKVSEYYNNYSANTHRGDYDLSLKVDSLYEGVREKIRKYINAKKTNEIIFTSGTTDSLNKIIFGYFKYNLKKGDEVLITLAEHASNTLPWFELQDDIGIKVKYIELTDNEVTLEKIKKQVTENTKVISLAHITNVLGDVRPIKEITKYAHENGILVLVDGAQSIGHIKVDVKDLDVDFYAFSFHKMYGPTGSGIIYGKEELLNNTRPIIFGGGMNQTYSSDGVRIYHELPSMLEAGTPNIASIVSFESIIDYINNVGIENIKEHELKLKKYLVKRLKEIKNIEIYNEFTESSIVTINMKDIFAQDLAIYLNKYNICVRAGNHCSKMLKEEIEVKNTVRISFGMYNTFDEIDKLIEVLKNENIKQEII